MRLNVLEKLCKLIGCLWIAAMPVEVLTPCERFTAGNRVDFPSVTGLR